MSWTVRYKSKDRAGEGRIPAASEMTGRLPGGGTFPVESGVACESPCKGLTWRGSLHRGRETQETHLHAVCISEVEGGSERPSQWSLAVQKPSSASPETSALHDQRSPEEERKQDAYQERLFLFFVTDPHLGLGRAVCRAGLAAAAYSPQFWVSLRGPASALLLPGLARWYP